MITIIAALYFSRFKGFILCGLASLPYNHNTTMSIAVNSNMRCSENTK